MPDEFPDPPNPPIGEGEEDSRFFVDMRDQPSPANPPLTNPLFAEILPPTESPPDKRWDPSSGEAMGFPLMKGCIMDDINGEDIFRQQIGRIYWRGEPQTAGELNSVGGPVNAVEGAGKGCDPCKSEWIGADCFAPISSVHVH
jgi:hypothetical protein